MPLNDLLDSLPPFPSQNREQSIHHDSICLLVCNNLKGCWQQFYLWKEAEAWRNPFLVCCLVLLGRDGEWSPGDCRYSVLSQCHGSLRLLVWCIKAHFSNLYRYAIPFTTVRADGPVDATSVKFQGYVLESLLILQAVLKHIYFFYCSWYGTEWWKIFLGLDIQPNYPGLKNYRGSAVLINQQLAISLQELPLQPNLSL